MPSRKKDRIAAYSEQLRQALNHFDDPVWLGDRSSLAAPYFLGALLQQHLTPVERGQALAQALLSAANALWPGAVPADKDSLVQAATAERMEQGNKGPRYQFLLLELRYFRRFFRPQQPPLADNDIAIYEYLSISRASYFNHLKDAQAALGEKLLDLVRPTLRLEQPLPPAGPLLGRDELLGRCLADLAAERTVTLSGPGGVGKSTLGAVLAHQWPRQPVFWYTLRPSFNDRLDSLLFSFGYFLHQQGASGLWRQLIAGGGRVDNPDLALAQARGDLQQLANPPLVCVDEMDVVYGDIDTLTDSQLQIQEFLDSLRPLTPMLLIGQRAASGADAHYTIENLSLAETAVFFSELEITLAPQVVQTVHTYTGGNPRLLHLCAALHHSGVALADAHTHMTHLPALQALWARFWQRLSPNERGLLQHLSVFRSPAPSDAWQSADSLERLQQQQVVLYDRFGGVTLLPVFRDLIYGDRLRFPVEVRDRCHLAAAEIRAARGEYTAAAHHFYQAGEAKTAVSIWFPHRQREIERGYAGTALTLFQQISTRHLDRREREALALLRAELLQLRGDPRAGLEEITGVQWTRNSEMEMRAVLMQGEFLNALGYPHQALERYEDGMQMVARLLNRAVRLRYRRGVAYIQQKELDLAWREALLAQYEAMHLQGIVQDEQGNYREAERYYRGAIALAKQAGHDLGAAQSLRELSTTLGRQAKFDEAMTHAQEAISTFEKVGDRLSQERLHTALAAHNMQAGRFQDAIEVAAPAVSFFEQAKMPYWTAVTASTLAEAYFETGELQKAEEIALKVLKLEETHTRPYALFTLGLVAETRHAPAQAADYFRQSQQLASETGDRYMEAYAWRALGKVYLAQAQHSKGLQAVRTALQQFQALGMEKEAAATQTILSQHDE